MRQEPSYFDDAEPRLVYIARTLKDALAIEGLLSTAGIDYGVEADRYRGGVVFQTERVGAFFYVKPLVERSARELLEAGGYQPAPAEPLLEQGD